MKPINKARKVMAAVEKATPGEWVAFCKNRVLAIMSGRQPRRDATKWKEIVKWAGFDGTDFPYQEIDNLFAIVAALNYVRTDLPALLAEHERLADRVARLEAGVERLGGSEAFTLAFAMADNQEARELRARMDFARALEGETR